MTDDSLTSRERQLYDLVPVDGTSLGNKRAQAALTWPDDRYWTVRDSLVDKGFLHLGRGQGGSIKRVLNIDVAAPTEVTADAGAAVLSEAGRRPEESLYEPLAAGIKGEWARDKRLNPLAVEVIARQGRRATGGVWSRPDIVSVEVRNYLYLPTKLLEVTTFEVKAADSINVQAVYEALAHRRSSTRAYVVLHVPTEQATAFEDSVKEVAGVARSHGVGVLTVGDPQDYSTWDEVAEAVRFEPDPERLEGFIDDQLPERVKRLIQRNIH